MEDAQGYAASHHHIRRRPEAGDQSRGQVSAIVNAEDKGRFYIRALIGFGPCPLLSSLIFCIDFHFALQGVDCFGLAASGYHLCTTHGALCVWLTISLYYTKPLIIHFVSRVLLVGSSTGPPFLCQISLTILHSPGHVDRSNQTPNTSAVNGSVKAQ